MPFLEKLEERALDQVRLIAYDMMLRCWALGIRHWKIISILITNYPLIGNGEKPMTKSEA
jgi:hypothetical protein